MVNGRRELQGLGANTDREEKAALTKALQFYLEAVLFHREQVGKKFKEPWNFAVINT
jgi:hypothetical protein